MSLTIVAATAGVMGGGLSSVGSIKVTVIWSWFVMVPLARGVVG
jgi:hypothetical protein